MHIGLDLLTLRWTRTGMHAYLRNLVREFRKLGAPHRLTPYLFGHPDAPEPDHVQSLGPETVDAIRYVWDRPRLRLLSDTVVGCPRLTRNIDRVAIKLWRRWACRPTTRSYPALPDAPDLFHHVAVNVYPLSRVNVVTLPDLGTLGEPGAHSAELIELINEGLPLAHVSDLVLTFSEHTRRDVAARLGLPLERIRAVPLAAHEQFRRVPDAERRAVAARYELADRPYILALGRLEARKNLVRLVEAFGMLRRSAPELSHRLVLAGEKGWEGDAIFATVRRLGLDELVRWIDFVPFADLPALIGGADLLAHPSLYEGFGLPPLEAMACNTPVVAAQTTSLPEVIGDAGLLADPHSAGAFAVAMRCVLTDRALAESLRARGRDRVRQFTWEHTARLTLAAYTEAERLSRENPRPRPTRSAPADQARAFWRRWVVNEVLVRTLPRLARSRRPQTASCAH
ncbi:Group 1 glycosyl transferase OS=Methanococcus maripaludis X1 GN=GYY_01890 PE=4 SV=1: Glycos_transf_1 [Gemmata massiliana]|uniref:Glycosyl transferase family 1 domain-containing protein n=1 Tax=Gemmata massiliana TaxID=1210884 RepID=A0A6P2D2X9_9BACT|nr:glycosyltransferase family 1 protein [Gemmata massiliana]VTR95453.1 Group 1 glycosyl transferase OS=Methanococcus maripaludis X1 GN=GYY_01890 PE=4 SV=1: Glycos_transf_1 [Gemmata massiliana]